MGELATEPRDDLLEPEALAAEAATGDLEEDERSGIVRSRPWSDPPVPRAPDHEHQPKTVRLHALPPRPPRPTRAIAPPDLDVLSRPPALLVPPSPLVPELDAVPTPPPALGTPVPVSRDAEAQPRRGSWGYVVAFAVGVACGVGGLRVADTWPGAPATLAEVPAPLEPSPDSLAPEGRVIETTSSVVLFAEPEGQSASAGEAAAALERADPGTRAVAPGIATRMRAAARDDGSPSAEPEPTPVAAPSAGPRVFDRAAAAAAATAAAARAAGCKTEGGPTGVARVALTFANSGRVTSALVSGPPFAGTTTGGCIARTMREATIPPFEGAPVTVGKTVQVY